LIHIYQLETNGQSNSLVDLSYIELYIVNNFYKPTPDKNDEFQMQKTRGEMPIYDTN